MSENRPKTMGENLRDLSGRIERENMKLKFKLWTMSDGAESHYCYFQVLEQAEGLALKENVGALLPVKIRYTADIGVAAPTVFLRGSYKKLNLRITEKHFVSLKEAEAFKRRVLDSLEAALCDPGEPERGDMVEVWDGSIRPSKPYVRPFLADLGEQFDRKYLVVCEADIKAFEFGNPGIRFREWEHMKPISGGIEALDNDVYVIR